MKYDLIDNRKRSRWSRKVHRIGAAGLLALAVALAPPAFSADVPAVRAGSTEIGGFVGASYGIQDFRVMGGGNVSYAVTRVLMPYVEYSYFPGIGNSQTVGDTKYVFSIPLSDFHGGVHIRIPIKESRVVPYGAFGVGLVHSYNHTEFAQVATALGPRVQQVPASGTTDFAANFGGGIRFYVNERFGFRVEAKAYKASGNYNNIFGKVEGGFFFQLK